MKRMKQWISMLLAISMMCSFCPVSVFAENMGTEDAPTAMLEIAAEAETVTEPVETTEATEPVETTEATIPEESTVVTEPIEITEATAPEETCVVTEPVETTEATTPEETTIVTEPAETAEETFFEETTVATEPAEIATVQISKKSILSETNKQMLMATAATTVASGSCGDKLLWELDENGVLTISGEGAMNHYYSGESTPWYSYRSSITSLVLEEGITGIGQNAFERFVQIDGNLVIPSTVKSIGEDAFYNCTGIDSLSLGNGVETIGNNAFYGCTSIKGSLILPHSLISMGYRAFYNCMGFTGDLTIPENIQQIGSSVFSGCTGLTGTLTLPEGMTEIGSNSFRDSSFTGMLVIPSTVTTIGDYAFSGCKGLTGLSLNSSLTAIGDYAFHECTGFRGDLVIPDLVTSIGNYAFYKCGFDGSLVLPKRLDTIGNYGFYDCSGFKGTLEIPEFVSSIGTYAFYSCDGFSGDLEIPDTITKINTSAFTDCTGLTGTLILHENLKTIGNYAFDNCGFTGSLVLPTTLTSIGGGAFYDCDSFTGNLYLPDSVTSLGSSAFYGCTGFTGQLRLPENLKSIGTSAFCSCSGITGELVVPNSVITLNPSCFESMTGITSITLGTGLTTLPTASNTASPFAKCTSVTEMTFQGLTVPTARTNTLSTLSALQTVYVPAGKLREYKEQLMLSLPDNAQIRPIGGQEEFLIADGVLLAYLGEAAEVVIPEDSGIEIIGYGAFQNCSAVTSVVIADTVTVIESYAFDGCSALQSVSIPDTVTEIGGYAFQDCSSLTAVTLPDALSLISKYTFRNCTSLAAVDLPESLTEIGSYAFYGCKALTAVEFPDGLTKIGSNAFEKAGLSGTLTFPDNLTTLSSYAFLECKALSGLELNKVVTIGARAFEGCTGLDGRLVIPDSVTSIGNYAFYSCTGVDQLEISDSVTSIGNYAFYNCKNFTGDLVIPDSVTTLGEYAFYNCRGITGKLIISNQVTQIPRYCFQNMTGLTEIIFGENLQRIGSSGYSYTVNPFLNDTSVTSITFLGATPPELNNEFLTRLTGLKTIYVANANLSAYISKWSSSLPKGVNIKAYDATGDFQIQDGVLLGYSGEGGEIVIPETVTKIAPGVFQDKTSITKVTMPETVTEIGKNAFYGCKSLKEVILSTKLETIGDYAFYNCTGLTGSFSIPGSVSTIGNYAFSGCTGLNGTLTFQEGLKTIGNYAFRGCNGLAGMVTLPDSLETLGDYGFQNVTNITGITLGSGLVAVGTRPFAGCSALTELTFRGNAMPTFSGGIIDITMSALTTVFVPGSAFGAYAEKFGENLSAQTRLKPAGVTDELYILDNILVAYLGSGGDVVIPQGVTSVGNSAFQHCTGLTSVTFPDSVITIGSFAFDGCTGLEGILTLPKNLQTIGKYAFYGCKKITGKLHFPDSLTNIGTYAFYDADGVTALEFGTAFQKIENYTFGSCNYVEQIVFNSTTVPVISNTGSIGTMNRLAEVYVPAVSYDAYLKALDISLGSGSYRLLILEGQQEFQIENGVVSGYFGIGGEVVIPEGVTAIANYAFTNCKTITKITMPDTVQTIGSYAFKGCTGLQELVLSEGLQSIGMYAFQSCNALTGVLRIPDGVKTIDSYAFRYCSALTGLTLGSQLTKIGTSAFYSCSGMRGDLILPNSLTTLGEFAFKSCGFNGSLVLSENLTQIPKETFSGCKFTGSLTIPNRVQSIQGDAFREIKGITSITVGTAVTSMDKGSYDQFYGCSGVREITFLSAKVPSGAANSIDELKNLETIYVPAASYDAYVAAFKSYMGANVVISTNFLTAKVTDLRATRVYSRTVALEWSPHVSEDVVGYTLTRDGNVVGTTETCTFTDRNLTLDQTYAYTVQGYTADGETTASAELSVTTKAPKAYELRTANGSSKVNESSNILRAYVSHNYSLEPLGQLQNTGKFYYEQDGQRILMGDAVPDTNLSTPVVQVYTLDWDVTGLEEGSYSVVFCAADPDGTVSECRKTITIDRSVPEKIAAVFASDNVTLIHVSWAMAAEVDTNMYRVYRRAATDEKFQLIAQIHDRETLTFTDTNVRTDRIYFYYVVGVNDLGQEGEPSDIVGATLMKDTTEPVINRMTPANGSWLSGRRTIGISAEDNVQVVAAQLYYSVDAGESWTLLKELTPGSWQAQLDTTALRDGVIRVKGIAYDAAGNASREMIYDYSVDNTGPGQVKNLSYSSTNVTVTLRWSNVADKDIRYFRVERKLESGAYEAVIDVYGTLGVNLYDLSPGTEYVYRVTGYDSHGNRGIPSEDVVVQTKNDFTPPVITDIQPKPGYYADRIPVRITASDEYNVEAITLQISADRISWQNVYTETYQNSQKTRNLEYTLELKDYSEGEIYVRAVARDSGGNESDIGVNAPYVQHIVDRTAPAVPEGVAAEGSCGFVELSWSQGSEQDLGDYCVYRSESPDGPYCKIAEGLQTVNYYDRSVTEGVIYYYRVAVQDLAGNESEHSRVVSAAGMPDTEKPKILSVNPQTGSRIGPGNNAISAAASDNSSLASVRIEFSTDGENYRKLCQLQDLTAYGDYAAAELPVESYEHGQKIFIRVYAKDRAGNESDAFRAEYTVDAVAPKVWSASAAFDTDCVTVDWTGGNEPDLERYRIYRGEDGVYTLAGYCKAETGKQSYSFRDTGISTGSALYTYKVEAVDQCGNSSGMVTNEVELPDRQFPRAVISCDNTMQYGVEYVIDGTASSDNTGIVSYFFDFGDGTTSADPKAVHKYEQAGEYTITLTVADTEGKETTTTKMVTVVDRALIGTVKVFVMDEYGTAVPGASVYLDLGEEDQAVKKTDNEGYASFTAQVGTHTIGCIIPDNQWLPVKKEALVTAGTETVVAMTLVHQPLIQGEFEVNRMTFEEIVAAGIDVADPANQHIVRVNVSLTYGESQKIDTSFLFNMTTQESQSHPVNVDTDRDGEADRELVPVVLGGQKDKDQVAVAYLDLPIGTSFLKEFFDVNLHIINNASTEFSMKNNVVTLNVPEGMAIVDAAGKEDHALVKIPEIPGQSSKTISWILRGDREGTYNLSANYSGILTAFDEPIYATFVSREPLKVYGLSAVKLIAEINSTIHNDAFYFNLALENVSDIDVNLPSVEVIGNVLSTYLAKEPTKEEPEEGEDEEAELPEIWNPQARHLNTVLQNASGNRQYLGTETELMTLRPGERMTKQYAVYNVVGFNNVMHLRSAIAEIADASGLTVEIIETDMDLFSTENAAEKLAALSGDKKALYDYILRNDHFFYVMEAVNRDKAVLDSIGAGSFGSARDRMNIGSYEEEARAITRKMVAQLLLDESLQEAIADSADNKYVEVAAVGVKSISNFLANTDGMTDQQQACAEAAQTGFADYIRRADSLRKLGTALKNEGYWGFVEYLLSQLTATGMRADAVELIRQHCQGETMTSDIKTVIREICGQSGDVLEKVEDLLDRWYDSEALFRDMIAISAAYEESAVLLEMLESNLPQGSPAAQEVRSIRNALENVAEGQTAGFLEQIGAGTGMTADDLEKYLNASFGVSSGTCYTFTKLVFGAAYDALTWNAFSDGRHVLQLNTELSFALTDAVRNNGLNVESDEQAVYTLKALKYLIKMRMLGEQNYVNYYGSMDSASQTEQLSWINQNMGTSYSALQEYASDILALLSEYRDTIFATYYTRIDIPEAPLVTIDYLIGRTREQFSAEYEYSFGGTQWHSGTGSAISLTPGSVPKSLRVRKKETASSLAGNVTKLVIPAAPRLFGDISVVYDGAGYTVSGLAAGDYAYAFVNEEAVTTFTKTVSVEAEERVVLSDAQEWIYLALQKAATEESFASQIRYVATKVPEYKWILDYEAGLAMGMEGETTAEKMLKHLQDRGHTVTHTDQNGNAAKRVGTGHKITVDGQEFTAVVRGDVNGDTGVNVFDLMTMAGYMNNEKELSELALQAAVLCRDDSNEDVNVFDLMSLVTYITEDTFEK